MPAVAAVIIGGVSLRGGRGGPLGVALGVLALCLVRAGLNALGVSPAIQQLLVGAVLLTVALGDGLGSGGLLRRLWPARL